MNTEDWSHVIAACPQHSTSILLVYGNLEVGHIVDALAGA